MEFNSVESSVLNRIQRDFPLTEAPFEDMARELKVDEDTLIATIQSMKERGIVRNVAGIFNPRQARVRFDPGRVSSRRA